MFNINININKIVNNLNDGQKSGQKSMNIKNNEHLQRYLYTFIFQDAKAVAKRAIWPVIVCIFCNYIYYYYCTKTVRR